MCRNLGRHSFLLFGGFSTLWVLRVPTLPMSNKRVSGYGALSLSPKFSPTGLDFRYLQNDSGGAIEGRAKEAGRRKEET